uniref:Uncharacterized protein n=1 Tax=Romanomermis culicivorax TaxID=13658 RepID=A0A915J2Y0_ROMCU
MTFPQSLRITFTTSESFGLDDNTMRMGDGSPTSNKNRRPYSEEHINNE